LTIWRNNTCYDECKQLFVVSHKWQTLFCSHVKLSSRILTLWEAFYFKTIIFTLWMEHVTVSLHRRNAQSKDDFWKHFSLGFFFFLSPSFFVFAEYTRTHSHTHTHTHAHTLTRTHALLHKSTNISSAPSHTLTRTMPQLTIQPATLLPETKHYFPLFIL
jgi:hypothetical protein